MKDLGDIRLSRSTSAATVRKKVRSLLLQLQEDDILATRTATCVSHVVRRYLQGAASAQLMFGLLDVSPPVRLQLTLRGLAGRDGLRDLATFFDDVRTSGAGDEQLVTATLGLPTAKATTPTLLNSLRELVTAKDRDELMAEVTERNQELQESLDSLRRTRSAKERMESELNIGHDIQMNMLPMEFPPFPDRNEFSIFARLKPAREVGGDFYDFFFIDADHLCVSIGDVSGKGVPSALFAAVTKTLLSSFVKQDPSPASVVTRASDELATNNESCMFVTLLLGILDVRTGDLVYTNAGHNPPYIKRANGEVELLDGRHGPIAGAMDGFTYGEGRVSLAPNDLLFLFTDGVVEATNEGNELYSDTRLVELLREEGMTEPERAVVATIDAVNAFEGAAPQFDDITILALHYEGADTVEQHRLRIAIANDLEQIATVIEDVEGFCERHDLPPSLAPRLGVALDELLNNIISYAYDDDGGHEIVVSLVASDSWIWVRVEDDGKPFNPFGLRAPDTEASIEDRDIGGLGIHFVRNMMDEVRYTRLVDRNVVEVGKKLDDKKENA
jgi:sigma-B regulation protein RsbU (phosphoserine phosphatase)